MRSVINVKLGFFLFGLDSGISWHQKTLSTVQQNKKTLICYNGYMTHTQRMREIAKFAAGLVTADLLFGFWLLAARSLPQTILGIWITSRVAWFWVGFDLFIMLVLVHYAWNPKLLKPHASSWSLFFLVGVITGAVSIAHFLRLVFGWSVVIGGWPAPMWASWVGVIVAAYISYASFYFAAKHGEKV